MKKIKERDDSGSYWLVYSSVLTRKTKQNVKKLGKSTSLAETALFCYK